ncbi:putative heme-binding domain-containing protein [Aquiflexum balticum DSM 16537]|uniref:Putative heme-binding domain-containing protein n=1 Tax=Aquiflexum balticum DSM 16537 TaxID=758820 RepID=A0A1W2H7H9_9BACT|nr:c-type cytochrome [Aquiflexum balticum]SMD44877.1 putative heme-binding domain-containing protein [Aquiflexum balticum DSM 16537]
MLTKNSIVKSISLLLILVFFSCGKKPVEIEALDPKVAKLKVPAGFVVEHLFSPAENGQGSWVGMTFDNKGRMIATDQYGALYRLEIPPIGSKDLAPKVEELKVGKDEGKLGMGYGHGVLYAFNSLYVMVNNNPNEDFDKVMGLYRLQDTNGDDQYDSITLIKALQGYQGEHGPHSMVLSPDKQSIYMMAGNLVDVHEMDAYRLPRVWDEDNIFPEIKDPWGHASTRLAPGGWIAKIDPEGKHWELISAGFRNPYDLAFNESGDLFTFDSDLEYDLGLPWYRPIRICHVTSGSEFGWRTGNQKWSPEYPDNVPATLNIGQGSPTNVMFGTGSNFPEKYRKALFAFDWSFGIIYAVHLEPSGATYSGTAEEFISGSPLPLTDGIIGPDGAMYFMTGGRKLQSDVYRVYYTGKQEESLSENKPKELSEAHQIRRKLEEFHSGGPKAGAVDFVWPYLKHEDRFIQYAARIAIEHQPVKDWQEKALVEKNPITLTQALISLVRMGDKNLQPKILESVMAINYGQLSHSDQLNLLRTIELSLFRQGIPSNDIKNRLINYLNPHFPSNNNNLDQLLSKILVHLDAPDAVEKIVAQLKVAKDDADYQKTYTTSSDLILRNPQYGLDIASMLSNMPPSQQSYFAIVLANAKVGWTPQLREDYFQWIRNAFHYKGGFSYVGFIDRARKMALSQVSKEEYDYFNELSGASLLTQNGNDLLISEIQPQGPGKNWTVEEAITLLEGLKSRDLVKGKAMFAATLCLSCHTMQGEGGVVGPNLSQLGTRFSPKDILESTINPNAVISDQYASTIFYLADGSSVLGKLINEDKEKYYISQNPFDPQSIREITKNDVTSKKLSEISVMMPGLINRLNEEELKDLMAYLISGGNPNHEVYQ